MVLGTKKELIPLEADSQDPKFFSKPKMILTHRFSVVLHLLLSHLKFDNKKKICSLEIEIFLGTSRSLLENLPQIYTSSILQSRVLGDIFRENDLGKTPQILTISKLIFIYLDLTSNEAVGLFRNNRLKQWRNQDFIRGGKCFNISPKSASPIKYPIIVIGYRALIRIIIVNINKNTKC